MPPKGHSTNTSSYSLAASLIDINIRITNDDVFCVPLYSTRNSVCTTSKNIKLAVKGQCDDMCQNHRKVKGHDLAQKLFMWYFTTPLYSAKCVGESMVQPHHAANDIFQIFISCSSINCCTSKVQFNERWAEMVVLVRVQCWPGEIAFLFISFVLPHYLLPWRA